MEGARGFTLIELLAVVAITSLLATVAFPLAELAHRRVQEEELRRSLREIRNALDAYKRLSDDGRIERRAGTSGFPPSLSVLVDGVRDARSPTGAKLYLLRRLPRDPMGARLEGSAADSWALRSYASPPDAPVAGDDVFDVRSRAPGTAIDGTRYVDW